MRCSCEIGIILGMLTARMNRGSDPTHYGEICEDEYYANDIIIALRNNGVFEEDILALPFCALILDEANCSLESIPDYIEDYCFKMITALKLMMN